MASYVFNNNYLKNGLADEACSFNNNAALTSINPSQGTCRYHSSRYEPWLTGFQQLYLVGLFTNSEPRRGQLAKTSDSIILNVDGDDNKSAIFGKHDLGKLLGSGAFAKVYQAEDLHNDRESVAIKVVQKKRLKDGLTAQVKREISVMCGLRHPHIVLLSEVLDTKTKKIFVMELAKGGELFPRVSSNRFTEGLSRKYFRQLISAVSDLKPENLLLDENRDLKVSDFGLSAMEEQIKSDGMLHTLCGIPCLRGTRAFNEERIRRIYGHAALLTVSRFKHLGTLPENPNGSIHHAGVDFSGANESSEKRITVEEILKDPWFNHRVDPSEIVGESGKKLNAFELIASSSTANLAGLFGNFVTPDHCDQFVSDESPAEIMRKVVEVARQLNLRIAKKKERAVKLKGSQGVANIVVKIRRLTDELVMVEMKNKQRDVGLAWADELRRKLRRIINQPVNWGQH
ncbi:unnamed protein product [Brassica napus]|uniref:non-specific serine/threonine protein kinase n=1 Tax=Brassica napus TaxID=3708 RepID=A0A816MY23_BRANA|nr:unnamed protein product [Brassica napus]